MQRKIIDQIFLQFSTQNPKPVTELVFTNNFTLTVAVILSAQATDISVNKATLKLFKEFDTAERMVSLGEEGLKDYIKSIGLFNTKAKNIIAMCRLLIDKYNSTIPDNFEELIKLPGVGRKTANVILNCAFGKPTMAVDTHVFRTAKRIGLADGRNPLQVEKELLKNIPKKWLNYAHHWLILHGRYTCLARSPKCDTCQIQNFCRYYKTEIKNQEK